MRRASVASPLLALTVSCSLAATEDLQNRPVGQDGGPSSTSDIGSGAPDLGQGSFDAGQGALDSGAPDTGPTDCDPVGGQYAGRWVPGFGWIVDDEGEMQMLSVQLGIGQRQHFQELEVFPDGRFVGRWAADPGVQVRGCTGVGPAGQAILQLTDCGPACDAIFEGGTAIMTWAPTGAIRLQINWVGTAYLDQISSGGCGPYRPPMEDICLPLRDRRITMYYEWSR